MRKALRLFLFLVAALVAFWFLAPREPVDRHIAFDADALGADLDTYLAAREARFDDITPGVEKRIVWAGEKGAKTPLSIVYLHGFSATSQEVRPLPDLVAEALGANLHYTRLSGHGRSGAALAAATAGEWIEDMAEALAIGRRLGDRVLILSTSTGGTLAALGVLDPELSRNVAGVVFLSPNFRVANPAAKILTWPGVRWWGPLVAGAERSFTPENEAHGKYWTTRYPTQAVVPMAALVAEAWGEDYSGVDIPALFLFSDADQVVSGEATNAIAARWGGRVELAPLEPGAGDDPSAHVLAGDILSPGLTGPVAERIIAFASGL